MSAVGTTYVQVRSVDGNGNLSASTTREITIVTDPCAGPPVAHGFTDVPARLDDAVSWIADPCSSPTFMDGFPDDTFRPSRVLNRAQAVNALWQINATPDVATPHGLTGVPAWVEPAVRWAVANQYLTGFADGSFGPTRPSPGPRSPGSSSGWPASPTSARPTA